MKKIILMLVISAGVAQIQANLKPSDYSRLAASAVYVIGAACAFHHLGCIEAENANLTSAAVKPAEGKTNTTECAVKAGKAFLLGAGGSVILNVLGTALYQAGK